MSASTFSNMNISEASWQIAIKFYLQHHWGEEKASVGFGPDWIRTLVSMATDSSHTVIMGKTALSRFYTPCIYAEGYIVFVFPFVRSYARSFVCSYFLPSHEICVKVLRQSFSSGVYLSNYLSESIHIWTIATLEG